MRRLFFSFLLAALALAPLRAEVEDPAWVQDRRLATLAERMLGANRGLCRTTMPLTGLILHSSDQYQEPRADWFANGPIAVAQVLPGSVAEQAGVRPADSLEAIQEQPVAGLAMAAGFPLRDAVFDQIARAPSPLLLLLKRAGRAERVALTAPLGCRSLVELLTGNGVFAQSDGRVIQVTYRMALRLNDDELAAVFAHELAHLVLEHNRRLEEAGVTGGLAQEFGRNRRLAREAEVEADLLSVHLLAAAGFEPQIAPTLWESDSGRALTSDLLRSRRYPSRRERARMMREEIAERLSAGPARLLSNRDRPWVG